MKKSPDLVFEGAIARHPDTVADQMMRGLIGGGMLGPGLSIERRESRRIVFSCSAAAMRTMPDRGELTITESETGVTGVKCELWCSGLRHRAMVLTVLAFLGVGLDVWALGGWLPALIGAPIVGVALGWGYLRFLRSSLLSRGQAYLANTEYLKSM